MKHTAPPPSDAPPVGPDGRIAPTSIVEEMERSYLDYAMSVIIARALPDVRDGMKPVHRRILYTMWQMGLKPTAKFRKSAAVVGECFVRDTIIATHRGLVSIQDVVRGDRVYTQGGLCRVVDLYSMPPRPLLRVRTTTGLENTVTPLQQFKVVDEHLQFTWKHARDLRVGDRIVSRQTGSGSVMEAMLPPFRGQRKYFNERLAYLLGQFLSDGYYEHDDRRPAGRIGFTSSDRAVISHIRSIIAEEFDYSPTVEERSAGRAKPMFTLRINRDALNMYLVDTFGIRGVDAYTKRIPPVVFCSPERIMRAFFAGLYDGDGSIHRSEHLIHYASISIDLARGLLLLLHQLGYQATLHCQQPRRNQAIGDRPIRSQHPCYVVMVSGRSAVELAAVMPLRAERKQQHARVMAAHPIHRTWNYGVNVIPYGAMRVFGELSRYHLGSGWYQDTAGKKFRAGITYPRGSKIRYAADLRTTPLTREQVDQWGIRAKLHRVGSPLAEHLDTICTQRLAFLTVASVHHAPPAVTYDLQVDKDHEFIANGMLAHNCLGKFHPHGDTAVYDAMVRMAQPWSLRDTLVAGQGNMGSVDGDAPAAMRYTEAKLAPIAEEMLGDLEKETVDFIPNYDASTKEPTVLPALLPNLLINGTVGIAVGMATSIPPHNLGEVCDAVTHLAAHPKATVEDLLQFVKGPDFPTGATIFDQREIMQAYATGKGSVVCRADAEITEDEKKGTRIIVTSLPYAVNKATLIEKIAELVQDKKIEGIRDLRDESSRGDVRVVIDLKKDAYPKKVLNRLYHSTQLQDTFHMNMLAIVDGLQPRVLNLKSILEEYLKHRREVVRRRTAFDLARAKERAHILEGLRLAILKIDAVIATIKKSRDRDEARGNLIAQFKLSEPQANAILDMRLAQLANLERIKVEQELKEKQALIAELEAILKSEQKMLGVITKEVADLKQRYATPRRTQVKAQGLKDFRAEDLIPNVPAIVMLTRDGYLKRVPPDTFKTQGRGGKGVIGLTTKEEDVVEHLFATMTHADVLFFTTRGRVFQLKAYDIPEASRTAKGQAVVNFLNLSPAETVSAILPISDFGKEEKFLVMVTRQGVIKKVELSAFANVRKSGLIALKLRGDDLLEYVKPSTGHDEILMVSRQGQAIRFKEKDVRPMGRAAAGVRGLKLAKANDIVVGMDVIGRGCHPDTCEVLVVMDKGFGKRTALSAYRMQGRGGSGIKTAEVTPKTGRVTTAFVVNSKAPPQDLIVVSTKGQVIRLPYSEVRITGRATQGVRVMRFKEEGDEVASVTYV